MRIPRPLFALVLVSCIPACTSPSSPPPTAAPELPGPAEWNRDVVEPADEEAATARESCAYRAGALPAETQGESHPVGAEIPIDHIVVAMMENRSFDHYLQKIGDVGIDADVAPEGFTNLDPDGNPIAPFPLEQHCFVDTAHSWGAIKQQIAGGAMSGFVTTNEGAHELPMNGDLSMLLGRRAMGYYTEADLPLVYWLAKNFSIGDRYFASAPTATWPNRMFMHAATSFGLKSNDFPQGVTSTLVDYLNKRKISWRFYYENTPTFAMFIERYLELRQEENRFVPMSQFFTDAAEGKLPQVAFIDPDGTSSGQMDHTDEHPPTPATLGQNWLAEAIAALVASPHWSRSAMFINYDEHGGLYDHVPPPKACAPDDRELDDTDRAVFESYGVRVPFFVVSPYAKKGYVSHDVYDHTSVVRFIEARFQIPALTHRDANALAPWDVFDFKSTPAKELPNVPNVPVDEAIMSECRALWGE
ncbi:phospholipase C [Polyangium fumosum]|uniref:Phospholipase C n=1 Tax=Polyangium fumosum TaxID=889272 RepID=A0A4V6WQG7_9BACT|nr:alkaline phosphatase family protein [Polyangium fumosum]TKC94707.1 hypothetical protein E8A74_47805 [Polyangium fumosum]